jgi:hypothetical protein
MEWVLDLIKFLGVVGIVVGAAAWLVQRLAQAAIDGGVQTYKAKLDRDLETHKAELKAQTDRAIEEYKSSLQIVAKEHEIRFGALHARRAEVLKDLYASLEAATIAAQHLAISLDSKPDWQSKAEEMFDQRLEELDGLFRGNKLFLDRDLAERIHQVLREVAGLGARHMLFKGDAQASRASAHRSNSG